LALSRDALAVLDAIHRRGRFAVAATDGPRQAAREWRRQR
jgi:hypothetical protein